MVIIFSRGLRSDVSTVRYANGTSAAFRRTCIADTCPLGPTRGCGRQVVLSPSCTVSLNGDILIRLTGCTDAPRKVSFSASYPADLDGT